MKAKLLTVFVLLALLASASAAEVTIKYFDTRDSVVDLPLTTTPIVGSENEADQHSLRLVGGGVENESWPYTGPLAPEVEVTIIFQGHDEDYEMDCHKESTVEWDLRLVKNKWEYCDGMSDDYKTVPVGQIELVPSKETRNKLAEQTGIKLTRWSGGRDDPSIDIMVSSPLIKPELDGLVLDASNQSLTRSQVLRAAKEKVADVEKAVKEKAAQVDKKVEERKAVAAAPAQSKIWFCSSGESETKRKKREQITDPKKLTFYLDQAVEGMEKKHADKKPYEIIKEGVPILTLCYEGSGRALKEGKDGKSGPETQIYFNKMKGNKVEKEILIWTEIAWKWEANKVYRRFVSLSGKTPQKWIWGGKTSDNKPHATVTNYAPLEPGEYEVFMKLNYDNWPTEEYIDLVDPDTKEKLRFTVAASAAGPEPTEPTPELPKQYTEVKAGEEGLLFLRLSQQDLTFLKEKLGLADTNYSALIKNKMLRISDKESGKVLKASAASIKAEGETAATQTLVIAKAVKDKTYEVYLTNLKKKATEYQDILVAEITAENVYNTSSTTTTTVPKVQKLSSVLNDSKFKEKPRCASIFECLADIGQRFVKDTFVQIS